MLPRPPDRSSLVHPIEKISALPTPHALQSYLSYYDLHSIIYWFISGQLPNRLEAVGQVPAVSSLRDSQYLEQCLLRAGALRILFIERMVKQLWLLHLRLPTCSSGPLLLKVGKKKERRQPVPRSVIVVLKETETSRANFLFIRNAELEEQNEKSIMCTKDN